VLPEKIGEMEKTYPSAFIELGYSNNLEKLSMKKKEKIVTRILATKFHTKPTYELRAGE
jgi:hypothetical protein